MLGVLTTVHAGRAWQRPGIISFAVFWHRRAPDIFQYQFLIHISHKNDISISVKKWQWLPSFSKLSNNTNVRAIAFLALKKGMAGAMPYQGGAQAPDQACWCVTVSEAAAVSCCKAQVCARFQQ